MKLSVYIIYKHPYKVITYVIGTSSKRTKCFRERCPIVSLRWFTVWNIRLAIPLINKDFAKKGPTMVQPLAALMRLK